MVKKDKNRANRASGSESKAKNVNAGRKRKRNRPEKIMLLLAFLAVLLGVYMLIADKAADADKDETDGENISVVSVDTADITELSWEYDGESYTLKKVETESVESDESDEADNSSDTGAETANSDDTVNWVWSGNEDVTLDQSRIESMLDAISHLSASGKIEAVTDFAQYGLAEPDSTISFTVKTADGAEDETLKTVTLLTGGYVSITDEYYAMIAGEDTVYTVDGDYIYDFDISASELEYTPEEDAEE